MIFIHNVVHTSTQPLAEPPTQKTIAQEAGVSTETVSHILGGRYAHRYSEKTQRHVQEIAQRLQYRPHRGAQMMRKGRSGLIGIVNSGNHSLLVQQKLMAVAHHLYREKYELLIQDALWFASDSTGICQRMLEARVEGLILIESGGFRQEDLDQLRQTGIPVVVIGTTAREEVTCLYSDRPWGYATLTRHLLSLGHRRIAFMVSAIGTNQTIENAFFSALKENASLNAEGQIYPITKTPTDPANPAAMAPWLPGKLGMEQIIQSGPLPDAVLCSNDDWALGALTACAEAGIRVPEDLAITGFDAIPMSEAGYVPLTTIRHPVNHIGEQAASLLLEMIRSQKPMKARKIVIKGELVVRKSCGAGLVSKKTNGSRPHP